jgi:uncharacterized surface protein with fasciclin (FAS1) repeats
MRISRRLGALVAGTGLAGAVLVASPSAASAHSRPTGERSLAAVLTADGNTFDRNSRDYDVVTQAVLAVLEAKPGSSVGVLADGSQPLTAFIPNDQAFRLLVKDLTGKWVKKESDVFAAVAGLGIDTVETVLLYHVVPGATITKKQARKANGASLTTAQGGTIEVKVPFKKVPLVILKDADRNDRDPFVVQFDINKRNKQIAHGISFVLRPVDL